MSVMVLGSKRDQASDNSNACINDIGKIVNQQVIRYFHNICFVGKLASHLVAHILLLTPLKIHRPKEQVLTTKIVDLF
jgi:hypothetical protein